MRTVMKANQTAINELGQQIKYLKNKYDEEIKELKEQVMILENRLDGYNNNLSSYDPDIDSMTYDDI